MSKQERKGLVPVLRFPEFRDKGEWVEMTLADVCDMQAGKFVRASEINNEIESNLYPCFGGNGLRGFTKSYTHKGTYSLIGRQGALCGNITLAENKFHATEHAVVVTPKQGVETNWLHCMLIHLNLNRFATGQAQPGLSVENLNNVALRFTPIEDEQQKIADCLSSIDELITAQGQKLDTLKEHKKALMQQLFPVEGETVPRMRFKEFINSKSWEAKFLKELGAFTGGGTPSKSNALYWEGNIPWISSSDILEESIHQVNVSRFITKEALENSATKIVPKKSILLVSRVGVGKLAISESSVCTSQDFTNFTPYKNNLTFLAYSLKSQTKTLLGYSQGMAIKGFTKEDISNLKLSLPSLEEQQKIADCLFSIDELITAQTQTLEALKDHKKGLMQQLFPSLDKEAG